MPDVTPGVPNRKEHQSRRGSPLWLWFVVGFLLVFIGLSLTLTVNYYDYREVLQTKLWHFYILEARNLGPTVVAPNNASTVLLEHLMVSFVGGIVTLGIGLLVKKLSRPV